MAPNDTNKPSKGNPVPPGAMPPDPRSRRADPRLWALLPVIALLILGAYLLGQYRSPEPPPQVQPTVQAPPPVAPQGKISVTEVPKAVSITPVPPSVAPPVNKPPKSEAGPSFKHEEPAVVLPNGADDTTSADSGSDAGSSGSAEAPATEDSRPVAAPDRDAVKLNDPAQEYPSSAYEEGVEGTAKVTFTITPDGITTDASIGQSSGDSRLDQAALDYVKRLRFRPAMKDGLPVPVQATRSVVFSRR
ncbi:MAG TPA: energy transducer TonB [Armatimonadota bacterium]|jgi:protein TonB